MYCMYVWSSSSTNKQRCPCELGSERKNDGEIWCGQKWYTRIGQISHPRIDGIGWAKSKVGFSSFRLGQPLRSYIWLIICSFSYGIIIIYRLFVFYSLRFMCAFILQCQMHSFFLVLLLWQLLEPVGLVARNSWGALTKILDSNENFILFRREKS